MSEQFVIGFSDGKVWLFNDETAPACVEEIERRNPDGYTWYRPLDEDEVKCPRGHAFILRRRRAGDVVENEA